MARRAVRGKRVNEDWEIRSSWTKCRKSDGVCPRACLRLAFGGDWREIGVSAQHHAVEGPVSMKKEREQIVIQGEGAHNCQLLHIISSPHR